MATKQKDTSLVNEVQQLSMTLSPKSNPYLLGHEIAEREFYDSFKSGAFHHSWIIAGPKGIGKATLAYRIVRYIFSLNNQELIQTLNLDTKLDYNTISEQSATNYDAPILDDDNDDDSYDDEYDDSNDEDDFNYSTTSSTFAQSSPTSGNTAKKNDTLNSLDNSPLKLSATNGIFERLLAGGLTDFMIVEREYSDANKTKLKSEISIDQIRKLKEFFSKTSSEGGYKIALIDSVDDMNANSANALLKILEEAPNKSLLLLVCNNYAGLLDTIKSRCRVLKLHPLSDEDMTTLIQEYIKDISSSDTKNLIELSKGSIGTAIDFYQNNGIAIMQLFFESIAEILNKKNKKILELTTLIGYSEIRLQIFENIYTTFVDNLIKLNAGLNISFASLDEERITKLSSKCFPNSEILFRIREQSISDFRLTPIINLDYTAVIVSAFERLKKCL